MPATAPSRSTPEKAKQNAPTADSIITTKHTRVEVLASPGSGKTHTLLRRIDHLLNGGVDAKKILVLTFSNAAVQEIQSRLVEMQAEAASSLSAQLPQVKTAHAFANALASTSGNASKLLNDTECLDLMRSAIHRTAKRCRTGALWPALSESARKRRVARILALGETHEVKALAQLLAYMSAANINVDAALAMSRFANFVPHQKVLPDIVAAYTLAKRKAGRIDYGDMLSRAVDVLTRNADATAATHVLVDEYQDCSAAQTALLVALATRPSTSIMVFGDPHQAIYGFAGSIYCPLADALANTLTKRLLRSRRLTRPVAAIASAVAGHDADSAIVAGRDGPLPVLRVDGSHHAQTASVVADIQTLMQSGAAAEEVAVLARTRALLAPIEQALLAANISTRRLGQQRTSRHALYVLRFVRILEQAIAAESRVDLDLVKTRIKSDHAITAKMWNAVRKQLDGARNVSSLEGRYRLCAAIYLRLLGGVRHNAEIRADVNRWEPFARGHADAASMRNAIRAFRPDAVITGTIHSAKGREWNHVLIVGATDGVLPHYAADDPATLADERNLMYVAITRAKQTLRLYHSPATHSRSRQSFTRLSRFLDTAEVARCFRKPR